MSGSIISSHILTMRSTSPVIESINEQKRSCGGIPNRRGPNDSGAAPLDRRNRRPVFRGETGVGFGFATFEKWLPEGTFDQPTITEGAKVFLGTASSGLSVNAKPRIS